MPRNEFHVRSAIASRVDARGYSGLTLFTRNATDVVSPTYNALGEGIFADILSFLNGNGSPSNRTFSAIFGASLGVLGGSPTVEVTITSEDRIRIASTEPFGIDAGDNNHYFGISPSGQIAVYDGSLWYEVIALNDWARGIVDDYKLNFTTAYGSASTYVGFYQDFPTFINTSTNSDSLTDIDISGYGWLIDEDGYTRITRRGATISTTWVNDSLRLFLGFTGNELNVNGRSGTNRYVKSTYPCQSIIVPSRPLIKQTLSVEEVSDAKRTMGNGWVGVSRGTYNRVKIDFYLDGPSDCIDLHRHWLNYCIPYLSFGSPITFYQDWGDSRSTGFLTDGDFYSSIVTVENNGYRGKIVGSIVDNSGAKDLNWPNPMRRRMPLNIVIEV